MITRRVKFVVSVCFWTKRFEFVCGLDGLAFARNLLRACCLLVCICDIQLVAECSSASRLNYTNWLILLKHLAMLTGKVHVHLCTAHLTDDQLISSRLAAIIERTHLRFAQNMSVLVCVNLTHKRYVYRMASGGSVFVSKMCACAYSHMRARQQARACLLCYLASLFAGKIRRACACPLTIWLDSSRRPNHAHT